MQKHLVLIDGHHLMYRAYYAIPRTLKTSNGELTNVTYGVASMLISMLRIERPDALLFCFDAGDETFRHQENATYKDGRAETPDEFYVFKPALAAHRRRAASPPRGSRLEPIGWALKRARLRRFARARDAVLGRTRLLSGA